MTRGAQREREQADAMKRAAKNAGGKTSEGNRLNAATSTADIMREKQRLAELKKQGIVEVVEEENNDDDLPDSKTSWKCAFTKDVMFSDGYKLTPVFEDKIMEVKAEDCTIGGSIVVNLVYHHELKEVKLDKAEFMAAIKAYLPRVVAYMKE